MKVRFAEKQTKVQIRWGGNDDPNDVLTVGAIYKVANREVHSWHTKIRLVGIEGVFNDVTFEPVE